MTKKPGILIGVLAFLCLTVPLYVIGGFSGLGLSVSYDNVRVNKVLLQPKILFINSDIPSKLKIDDPAS